MGDIKNFIAARVAKELKDGDVVNLGIGLPTLVPNHLPEGVDLTLQSENGFVGLVPLEEGKESPHVVNAGGVMAGIADDGAFFSSADSFAIIQYRQLQNSGKNAAWYGRRHGSGGRCQKSDCCHGAYK